MRCLFQDNAFFVSLRFVEKNVSLQETMNHLNIILRILLGLIFILSAVLKLFPIEAFDANILEQFPFIGWTFSMILARIIIGFELTLGILIIVGFWMKKIVYPITLAMLAGFTFILIYSLVRFGNLPNCGCFGELLPFSNIESLIKNLVLITLTFYLYKKSSHTSYKYWWVSFIILAVSITAIFLTNKVTIYGDDFEIKKEIPATHLEQTVFSTGTADLNKQHLIVFVSPNCVSCRKMLQNLQTIHNIYGFRDTYILIKGEENAEIAPLLSAFPHQFIKLDIFDTYLIAPYLPLIALIDERGIYQNLWTASNFNLNKVIPLLQREGILEK